VRSSTGFTAVTTSGPFPLLAGRQGLGLAPPTLAQGDTVSLFFLTENGSNASKITV
jgi:hypothetical protein